jgi:hypothetical protein
MAMDLRFSPDDNAFRQQVRAFIRHHYPAELRVQSPYTDPTERQRLLWQGILRYRPKPAIPCLVDNQAKGEDHALHLQSS